MTTKHRRRLCSRCHRNRCQDPDDWTCPACVREIQRGDAAREPGYNVIDNFPTKGQFVRLGPKGMHVRSKAHWKEEMKRVGDETNMDLREYDG